jgi:hypothetical protein
MILNCKPMAPFKMELDTAKIEQVYEGRLNVCRCGCAGEYYEPNGTLDENGEARAEDLKIIDGLQLLRDYNEKGKDIMFDDFGDRFYFEIMTKELMLSEMDKDDDDDWDGRYDEPVEMGWAFYVKK